MTLHNELVGDRIVAGQIRHEALITSAMPHLRRNDLQRAVASEAQLLKNA